MMKIPILLLLLVIGTSIAGAQASYHYYYDSTTQWRIFNGGISWPTTYAQYYTYYFDGDTLIGSNWYYRQYARRLDSNVTQNYWPPGTTTISVDTVLLGPAFVREDSSHKVWHFDASAGQDVLSYDWAKMPAIGDTFQNSPTCVATYVDSISLGSMPLKRVRPAYNADSMKWSRGLVEGVGQTFSPCGMGLEGNMWLVCYSSHGSTILFSHQVPCGSFLDPVFTHYSKNDSVSNPTNVRSAVYSSLDVFPNPTTSKLYIRLSSTHYYELLITDQLGHRLFHSHSSEERNVVDLSSLANGLYFLTIISDYSHYYRKIIKE